MTNFTADTMDVAASSTGLLVGALVASSSCSLAICPPNVAPFKRFPDLLFRLTVGDDPDALYVLIEVDENAHVAREPSCEAARLQRIAFDAPAIPPHAHLLVVRLSTAQLAGENPPLEERVETITAAIQSFAAARAAATPSAASAASPLAASSSSSSSSSSMAVDVPAARASVLFAYYPLEARPQIDALVEAGGAGIVLLPPIECTREFAAMRTAAELVPQCPEDNIDMFVARREDSSRRTITAAARRAARKRSSDGAEPAPKK